MELKDKLPTMSEDEMLKLLSTDGMLVKRPILVSEDFVLVGFKETEWEAIFSDSLKKIKAAIAFGESIKICGFKETEAILLKNVNLDDLL